MWFIWLLIGVLIGGVLGAIHAVWVKKRLADAEAEIAALRARFRV